MGNIREFVTSLPGETRWHGNHKESGNRMVLNAGNISLLYENGNLRYISVNKLEILRMIYSAVRGREWLTIKPVISGEEFDIQKDSFRIKFEAHYLMGEINFQAHYSIIGNSDNSLIFKFEGEALNSFEKNRIGLCVLHPVESVKGEKCVVVHTDNKPEELVFPYYISQHQPFKDIKSMIWNRSGFKCSIDFSGDVFESEDQRNWTDASYKTYCTPLEHPFPVRVGKGERISQKIELKVLAADFSDGNVSDEISMSINREPILPVPRIGIGRSSRPQPLEDEEVSLLRQIKFSHYRIDVYLFKSDWESELENGLREAALLGYKTELALFLDDNFSVHIQEFSKAIRRLKYDIDIVLLYHKTSLSSPDSITDIVVPLLKTALPGVIICCGTNANFAQLNRCRPESAFFDNLCYSIHPQEHASDNLTLIENLQSMRDTVESAGSFSPDKGIWVSPVNIQRRFNANVTAYEQPDKGMKFPLQADSRLMSLFGGCWAAISLKYLIHEVVNGITYFETVGERGIIQGDNDSQWPGEFQTCKGMIFPVYHVFKFILGNENYGLVWSASSHPLQVDSLVMSDNDRLKMILVNFSTVAEIISIKGWQGELNVKTLNELSYIEAVCDADWLANAESIIVNSGKPLFLEPCSINFIEG